MPVVLDGVGQQVEQHLAQPRAVAQHLQVQRAQLEAHPLLRLQRPQQRQRALHQRPQRYRLQRDGDLAAFNAGQIQHVVDEAQQVLAGRADVVQPALARQRRRVVAGLVGDQQLRKTQHGVQRRAQLVAHARQELGLGRTLAQRDLTFLAHGLGGAAVGDVPVDADAAALAAGFVDLHRA